MKKAERIKLVEEAIKEARRSVKSWEMKNIFDYLYHFVGNIDYSLSGKVGHTSFSKEIYDKIIEEWVAVSKRKSTRDIDNYYKKELIREYNAFFPKKGKFGGVMDYLEYLSERAVTLLEKMDKVVGNKDNIKKSILSDTILRYVKYNFKDGKKYKKKDITKLIKSYSAGSAIEEEFQESIEGLLDKKIVITTKSELVSKINSLIDEYVSQTSGKEFILSFPYGDHTIFEGDYSWMI